MSALIAWSAVCLIWGTTYLGIRISLETAYINPVLAVALGVAVLGEPFTSRMALAAALVFAGVAIVRAPRGSTEARTHVKPLTVRVPDVR